MKLIVVVTLMFSPSLFSLLSTLMLPPAFTHCAKSPFLPKKLKVSKIAKLTLRSLRPIEAVISTSILFQKFLDKNCILGSVCSSMPSIDLSQFRRTPSKG